MKLFKRKNILGCDKRGDGDSVYMVRYTVIQCRYGSICVHVFKRSDSDEMHDHPWNFLTFILFRGYREHTPAGVRRLWPFTWHFRPATWVHRVELLGERPAVTLVVRGPFVREWGFITRTGWKLWKDYFSENGC